MDHSSKNVPNLRNLLMEMRKLCCHPYLCDGLEVGTCAHKQTLLFLQSSQSLCAFLENARLVLGKLWGRCLHSHRPALLWTDAACAVG